ncbi:MAG: hypothetical protein G01um101413_871 [Parcubacteria group bacterium Gr01-1014_13]|nr:MAG: hypothetical protein G01um101413_871 [Parcubacteria group bacterium Gr01-1014_13]
MATKTRDEMIAEMRKWLEKIDNPDEPFVGSGHKTYSLRQVLEEIEAGTELGERLLASALKLSAERDE